MRSEHRRYLRFAFVLAALAVTAALVRFRPAGSAEVRVHITGYAQTNDQLIVSAVATNLSSETLVYQGEPPPAQIHWQTDESSNISRPKSYSPSSIGFLRPNGAKTYQFTVPASARKLQVHCEFETLGFRGRLWLRLSQVGWAAPVRYLLEAVQNVVPERRRGIEFWSQEILTTSKQK